MSDVHIIFMYLPRTGNYIKIHARQGTSSNAKVKIQVSFGSLRQYVKRERKGVAILGESFQTA